MTTRSIVPNGDGEGSLGTASLKWGKMYSSDPASGENSGQVPTTAWAQQLVAEALKTAKNEIYKQAKLDAHPVGSYYWSNDSTSPTTLFGGTWEALPAGYTLIAQGSGTDDFGSFNYVAGTKYGERMHKLTTDELSKIKGDVQFRLLDGASNIMGNKNDSLSDSGVFSALRYSGGKWVGSVAASSKQATDNTDVLHLEFGNNQPHNTLPPSIACYGWRRTA